MFNLKFMNRALKEVGKGNLTTTEFTMLCLLNNDAQLNKGDVIERHNAYYMKCLNLSERQVQRLFKSLEKKDYVEVERTGTSENRKENSIRLKKRNDEDDIHDDINDDINVTLKKTSEITCKKHSSMDQKKKPSGNEIRKYNEYIDQTFRTLEERLNYYYTLTTPELCGALQKELTDIFKDAQEKKHYFTDAQWEKLCRYGDRWGKIEEGKTKYLNSDKAKTGMTSVEDDEPQEYNEIQSNISYLGEDSESAAYGFTG